MNRTRFNKAHVWHSTYVRTSLSSAQCFFARFSSVFLITGCARSCIQLFLLNSLFKLMVDPLSLYLRLIWNVVILWPPTLHQFVVHIICIGQRSYSVYFFKCWMHVDFKIYSIVPCPRNFLKFNPHLLLLTDRLRQSLVELRVIPYRCS